MIELVPGMGVIIDRKTMRYLLITEAVQVQYRISWKDATMVEQAKWDNPDIRQQMIDFHELQYEEHNLEFIPVENLIDPFGDLDDPEDDLMRYQ